MAAFASSSAVQSGMKIDSVSSGVLIDFTQYSVQFMNDRFFL